MVYFEKRVLRIQMAVKVLSYSNLNWSIFKLCHRPGNVQDSKGAANLIINFFQSARAALKNDILESRVDATFLNQDVFSVLAHTMLNLQPQCLIETLKMILNNNGRGKKSLRLSATLIDYLITFKLEGAAKEKLLMLY